MRPTTMWLVLFRMLEQVFAGPFAQARGNCGHGHKLAAKRRKTVFERIGADHALTRRGEASGDGLMAVFGRIVDSFVTATPRE